jgi:hypothetical protein
MCNYVADTDLLCRNAVKSVDPSSRSFSPILGLGQCGFLSPGSCKQMGINDQVY